LRKAAVVIRAHVLGYMARSVPGAAPPSLCLPAWVAPTPCFALRYPRIAPFFPSSKGEPQRLPSPPASVLPRPLRAFATSASVLGTLAPSLNAAQQASAGTSVPFACLRWHLFLAFRALPAGPHLRFGSPPFPCACQLCFLLPLRIAASSLADLPLLTLFPRPACLPRDLPLLLINSSELVFGQLCTSNLLPLPFAPDQGRVGRTNCRQTAPSLPLSVRLTADSLMAVACTLNPSKMLFPGWCLLQTPVSQGCEEVKSLPSRAVPASTLLRAPLTPDSSFCVGKCVQGLYPALPMCNISKIHIWSQRLLLIYLFPSRKTNDLALLFVHEIRGSLCQDLCSVLLCV